MVFKSLTSISSCLMVLLCIWQSIEGRPTAKITKNEKSITGKILWLSDFHVDMFYGSSGSTGNCKNATAPAYGAIGCDAPLALVAEVLKETKIRCPEPDFIIVTGDYLRHDKDRTVLALNNASYLENIFNTVKTVTAMIESFYPSQSKVHLSSSLPDNLHEKIRTSMALGNNDFTGDYYLKVNNSDPENVYLSNMANYIKDQIPENQLKNYHHGGFYSTNVSPGLHVISLNTVIYSVNHQPGVDSVDADDPLNQFAWLKETLESIKSKGEKAYITGHILPGYDSYGPSLMWQDRYTVTFLNITSQFSSKNKNSKKDVIAGLFFGHIHSSEYRVLPYETQAPFLISPAVSPVYGNSPGFGIITYDLHSKYPIDWGLYTSLDITSYNASIPENEVTNLYPNLTWEPIFESALEYFDLKELTNPEWKKHNQKIFKDEQAWSKWLYQYKQGHPDKCFGACQ
eukprot:Awhi_evm1s7837